MFRYGKLAFQAPYSNGEKWEIFIFLVSLWFKAFFLRGYRSSYSQKIFGFRISGFSYTSLSNIFEEVFISGIYAFKAANSKPVIIDCGANIGMATLYFKKLYPDAIIYAFEPAPEAYVLLRKNIAENNLKHVTLFNEALSDETGLLNFFASNKTGGLNSSFFPSETGQKPIQVKVNTLSSFLETLPELELIKMDVEGAETNIIKDLAENNQLTKAKQYLAEYHHYSDSTSSLAKFLSHFENAGFHYNLRTVYPAQTSQQDLVFHFRDAAGK